MKKNILVPSNKSFVSRITISFLAILLTIVGMVAINLCSVSSCTRLVKSIGEKERVLSQCRAELDRNIARWEAAKSSGNLERALIKRGMAMYYPKPNQIIRMDGSGSILPSQTSVALLRRRAQERSTAQLGGRAVGTSRRAAR